MFVTRCTPERSRSSAGTRGPASARLLTLALLPGVMLRRGLVPGEDVVEPLEHVLAEVDGDRVLRVVQLVLGARADDRPGDALLVQQPGQRHVGRLLAELVAQGLVGRDLLAVPFQRPLGPAREAPAALALRLQHAAQQPALERGPRDHADAVLDRRGQYLELDFP